MEIQRIENFYNSLNVISVVIEPNPDFDYIQKMSSKISHLILEINNIIEQILLEKSILENKILNLRLRYGVLYAEILDVDSSIKKFSSEKERRQYIEYYLLKKEFKEIKQMEQDLRDLENLLGFARKKSKDLERNYAMLKIQFSSVNNEIKYLKKIGSDGDEIERVQDRIKNDREKEISKTSFNVFIDDTIEDLISPEYNENNEDYLETILEKI